LDGTRFLVVTADDYGIGPATSQGILDLAGQGLVTASVLLVNSPHAEEAVRAWRRAGEPMELGWHPCLTLDRPLCPAAQVPSLVRADGRFVGLAELMRRCFLGRLQPDEVECELAAQLQRFRELVGTWPTVVNSHHHVQIFPPVGRTLHRLLRGTLPYVRRIRESWRTLLAVRGARLKRLFLTTLGKWEARALDRVGFPGNDGLAGVTDPEWVADPEFLCRWLRHVPGRVVELTTHPGTEDVTLLGRDALPEDGYLQRRVHELALLRHPSFREACDRAGFRRVAPARFLRTEAPGHAA
jgi:chitin disaccharide deacetylase